MLAMPIFMIHRKNSSNHTLISLTFFRNTDSKVLWDESTIETSLRSFVNSVFENSATDANFYETIDTVILQNICANGEKLSESQKDACLLWTSWKSQASTYHLIIVFKFQLFKLFKFRQITEWPC